MPADGATFVAEQDRRDRRQPGGVGEDRVHPQLRRERRPVRPRRAARPASRHAATSSSAACRSAAGFRVPCIIVSPWTVGGWVAGEPFDHTSVLRFLEKFTGVREPNISEWRRRSFGDLTSAFRFAQAGKKPPALPDTVGTLNLARYASVNLPKPILPGADQEIPRQEKGRRNRLSKS